MAEGDMMQAEAAGGEAARLVGSGCFLAGTMLDTPDGKRDVAALRAGDMVDTISGPRPLTLALRCAAGPTLAVRMRPGALADRLPARETLLAADQQVMLQDQVLTSPVLVGLGVLVNAGSIQREMQSPAAVWYALECAEPEILLADGLGVAAARVQGQPARLRVLPPGPTLFGLRARLAARVATVLADTAVEAPVRPAAAAVPAALPGEPSWTEPDGADAPDLRLVADGQPAAGGSADGLDWSFLIPAGARFLRLASPVRRAGGEDQRRMGVAVRALALDGVPLALDGLAAGAGFYPPEGIGEGMWRWTDGHALLRLPPGRRPRRLSVTIADWHRML